MYEDPSALFKGWQENIVNFDSVFNRSEVSFNQKSSMKLSFRISPFFSLQTTFAWGSPDILKIFDKTSKKGNFKGFAYDSSIQDFSGGHSTIALDSWVFDNVERFLNDRHGQLQMENETIYFLHLLGLDTAGHVHKPNTKYKTFRKFFVLSI